MKNIEVNGERKYSVDFVENWVNALESATSGRQSILIYPESLRDVLKDIPKAISQITVPDGELQKDSTTYIRVMDEIARNGLTRSDVLIGIGGGATTDMTGFVAATYLRGIEWIAVPTSLAGMVDASVGGKTGINLTVGKNLAGAFHSPSKVIVDLRFLETLSDRDLKAGMAEIAKCGFIADLKILDLITEQWRANLPELIHRAVSVKADVV